MEMSLDEPYTYQCLAGVTSIRIIALQPSLDFNADLHCEIIHGDRDDIVHGRVKDLHWEAVSYEWGANPKFNRTISCDHAASPRSTQLSITSNVDQILRYLRKPTSVRLLWIDSICLNQQDEVEKSIHIAWIGEVFRLARKVHLWLGRIAKAFEVFALMRALNTDKHIALEEHSCDEGSRRRRDMSRRRRPDELDRMVSGSASVLHRMSKETWLELKRHEAALRSFLEHSFWTRRWIVQEIYLAPSATLRSGEHTLPFSVLSAALHSLRGLRINDYHFNASAAMIQANIRAERNADVMRRERNLLYFLDKFDKMRCSDNRDNLFALSGLLAPGRRPAACIDLGLSAENYGKALPEILAAVALHAYRALSPYDCCQNALASFESSTIFGSLFAFGSLYHRDGQSPSWIPCWTTSKPGTLHHITPVVESQSKKLRVLKLGVRPSTHISAIFCNDAEEQFVPQFESFIRALIDMKLDDYLFLLLSVIGFFDGLASKPWRRLWEHVLAFHGQRLQTVCKDAMAAYDNTWMQETEMLLDIHRHSPRLLDVQTREQLNDQLRNTVICFLKPAPGLLHRSMCFVPRGTQLNDVVIAPFMIDHSPHCYIVASPRTVHMRDIMASHDAESSLVPGVPRDQGPDTEFAAFRILGQAVRNIYREGRIQFMAGSVLVI